jgi:hypothetical protein
MGGIRGVLSLRGYLYLDDFAFRYWASTQPFGVDYLTRPYGGHVNPVGLAVQWLLQSVLPGSYIALTIFAVCCFVVSLILLGAVLWQITRRAAGVVLGVLVAGMSLFTFEVTVWWAGAIYAGPYQVFLLACLYGALMRVKTGGVAWSGVALVAAAGAGLSFSRGALGLVLVFALVASLPLSEGRALGPVGSLASARAMWAGMAAIAASSAYFVVRNAGDITSAGFAVGQLPGYAWRLLVLNILPAVWGGPWRWFELPHRQWSPVLASPAPMWWAVWMSAIGSLVAVAAMWARRRELRGPVVTVACYTLAIMVVAGIARSGTLTASVAYRYTFDLVWPTTILPVLAVVPAVGVARRLWRPGVALLSGTVALAVWSTVVPARDWAQNRAGEYVANAVSGFSRIPPGQSVLDQGVPFDLIHPGFMAPYANARSVLTPQSGAPDFGPFVEDTMFGFASDGTLEKNDVEGPASREGPDSECGYRVTNSPRRIPLEGSLIAWEFYARVAYFSGTETTLNFAFGGQIHTVPLRAGGLRAIYFPVTGPGRDVLVSTGAPGAVACVTDVRVGNRVSSPTGERVPLPITGLIQ